MFKKKPADTKGESSLDDIAISQDSVGTDATYYQGVFAQLVRMWRFLVASMILNCLLVGMNFLQVAKYVPAVQLVDATTQKPYVVESAHDVKVGKSAYNPIQIKATATSFVMRRYAYNTASLQEDLEAALTYMTQDAAEREKVVIQAQPWKTGVVDPQAKYELALNQDSWKIVPTGENVFDVSVSGTASITNASAFRNRPFVKEVSFTIKIRRGETTPANPVGYYVIEGSKDIL